jgi:branched-subunit amino acid aminotransferase/4-amino-4-deoxychorismate lyase
MARSSKIPVVERNISISEVYSADEIFCTGTVGELTPVLEVDGRLIGDGKPGKVTQQLRGLYAERTSTQGEPLPF